MKIHYFTKLSKSFFIGAISLLFINCSNNDNAKFIAGTNSIVNNLENNPNYSEFLKLIERADYKSILNGNAGEYTVLIPDDAALMTYLEEINRESVEDLPKDEAELLLNYHILSTYLITDDFMTGYMPTSARIKVNDSVDRNLSVFVNRDLDTLLLNETIGVQRGNELVDNGIIHFISAVMSPPPLDLIFRADESLRSFYEELIARDDSEEIRNRLTALDLKTTFLVPNSLSVEDFFSNKAQDFTREELLNLLKYHVLESAYLVENFETGYGYSMATETYSGQSKPLAFYVDVENGINLNSAATLNSTDILTINGVIHTVDSLLLPPDIENMLQVNSQLSTYFEALHRTEQQGVYQLIAENKVEDDGPLTLFVPTDDAFKTLFQEKYNTSEVVLDSIPSAELEKLLKMHLLPNQSWHSENMASGTLSTSCDNIEVVDFTTVIDPNNREANILVKDIQTLNGVIHIIDQVLLPESNEN